jgi:hypothetical protein
MTNAVTAPYGDDGCETIWQKFLTMAKIAKEQGHFVVLSSEQAEALIVYVNTVQT